VTGVVLSECVNGTGVRLVASGLRLGESRTVARQQVPQLLLLRRVLAAGKGGQDDVGAGGGRVGIRDGEG
jgi:hypothetical protein